ncbi:LysR family transcriptional regulator [Sphingomonas sp.]|uniref:LysR family transcriptional regulator n=1 Tax=Sphingomonas sp. TaxID=28214 RepID=UPI003B00B0EA
MTRGIATSGLNWDDLRVFLAIARGGSLTAAARRVGQDATTVARRLQRLEAALGATLFEQGLAGHVATEAGQALLAHAEIMESGAQAIAESLDAEGGLGGSIRVSVSEGFGTFFVAPRLGGFAAAHPSVAIDLIAATGFLNPSRREADVAIMLARPRGGPVIAAKLTDYRLGAYASLRAIEAEGPIADVAMLGRRRLIGYVPDLIYAPELRYLAEVDERLAPSLRSSSIAAQARLIASGAGCGILPCFIGDATPNLVRVLRREVAIERSFWLVVHRDRRHVARIARFIAWLRGEVAAAKPLLLGA